MCLCCNLCLALLSLSPCSDLGKCGCCTQNPSLGNLFIHTAKGPWRSEKALTEQSQAFSGCTAEAVNPSETPKAAHMYPASPTPCQLVQACPPSRAKARPAQQPTPPAALVFRLVVAWFTWKHLPSRTGDLRGPWTLVHQLMLKHRAHLNTQWGFPDAIVLSGNYLPRWPHYLSPLQTSLPNVPSPVCLVGCEVWAAQGGILVCRAWCSVIMFS